MTVAGSPAHEQVSGIGEAVHVTDLGNEHLDDTVRLWDAATGQPAASRLPATRAVRSVEFSPDGTRIATSSEDQTMRLWERGHQPTRRPHRPGDQRGV